MGGKYNYVAHFGQARLAVFNDVNFPVRFRSLTRVPRQNPYQKKESIDRCRFELAHARLSIQTLQFASGQLTLTGFTPTFLGGCVTNAV